MKNLFFSYFLFLSTISFSQNNRIKSDSCETNEIRYFVQIFTSVDEEATKNEASTLLDETIIEKVYIKNQPYFRVIISVSDIKEAKRVLEIYKESYKDCLIVVR